MVTTNCKICGVEFSYIKTVGRPREKCDIHRKSYLNRVFTNNPPQVREEPRTWQEIKASGKLTYDERIALKRLIHPVKLFRYRRDQKLKL